jgi:N-acetyl-alpha-D-muramate 1-phosphate uridylyltransferase
VQVINGSVAQYGNDPTPRHAEHIDYGMLAFDRVAWDGWASGEVFDLAAVLQRLIRGPGITAFEVSRRFYDIGTPEALRETEDFLRRELTTK